MPKPLDSWITIFQVIPQAAWYRSAKCLLGISQLWGQRVQIKVCCRWAKTAKESTAPVSHSLSPGSPCMPCLECPHVSTDTHCSVLWNSVFLGAWLPGMGLHPAEESNLPSTAWVDFCLTLENSHKYWKFITIFQLNERLCFFSR